MSVVATIIADMTNWNKYTHVCHTCDALIEYTSIRNVIDITCECGGKAGYLSVEDATIPPTTTKEGQMETATNYDANVLVTYKDITDGVTTYPTLKVNELEWKLERIKRLEQQLSISKGQISRIIENLSEDGWFNPNYEKEEVLNDLCEILDYEPKKEISFEGVIHFSGRVDIKLADLEDFDLEDMLSELTVDVYNGDVVIDDYSVEDVREC